MPGRLDYKLIVTMTTLMVVVGAISTYVGVREQKRHMVDTMILGATQLSESITSATWHSMLAGRRDQVHEIMRSIAKGAGIERIRMFDHAGVQVFPEDKSMTAVSLREAACKVCHQSQPALVRAPNESRVRIEDTGSVETLNVATPIYNEPACTNGSCHAHRSEEKVLGILDVALPLDPVRKQARTMTLREVGSTAAVVLLGAVAIVLFTRRFVAAPIRDLVEGTRKLSNLDLDRPIEIAHRSQELEQLVQSFNTMRERLQVSIAQLNEMAHSLEDKVAERTHQLKAAHAKLLQADRLTSLGQLAASVAHEINNPISGVLNLSVLVERIIQSGQIPKGREQEVQRHLAQITLQTERVGRIVSNLLAFSRQSKPQRVPSDLNRIVQAAIGLVSHKLQLMDAVPRVELAHDLPLVECDSTQMQQVVLNLVINAAEAMQNKGGGTLTIRTLALVEQHAVALSVHDTGEGIAPEHLPNIFDPFFTTKSEGKGVGLGLALLYGIVKAHGGEVEVSSRRDEGTAFSVTLPLKSSAPEREVPWGVFDGGTS